MLHRTVAPDLAAEAQRVRELKAQGKNPDGTPYVHLPGQNAPPPVVSDCFLSSVAQCRHCANPAVYVTTRR